MKTIKLTSTSEINPTEGWNELLRVGDWGGSVKDFVIKRENLQNFVKNFDANVLGQKVNELQVNYSHHAHREAAGWIEALKLEGDIFMGKIRFTPKGKEKILNEEFRHFSSEFTFSYEDDETVNGKKKVIKDVFLGAALTNIPFVSGLDVAKLSKDLAQRETESHIITNFQNMKTFQKLASSLAEKQSVSSGEFELLSKAFETVEEDKRVEAQVALSAIKSKINTATDVAKELLSRDTKIEELSKQVSELQSEKDKLELSRRTDTLTAKVEKLSNEGRLNGEGVVENTVKMLLSMNAEQAESTLKLLSNVSVPKELGATQGVSAGKETDVNKLAEERAKSIMSFDSSISLYEAKKAAYAEVLSNQQ